MPEQCDRAGRRLDDLHFLDTEIDALQLAVERCHHLRVLREMGDYGLIAEVGAVGQDVAVDGGGGL
jgi:hypothetical protein